MIMLLVLGLMVIVPLALSLALFKLREHAGIHPGGMDWVSGLETKLGVGDRIIYIKHKFSTRPANRALNVHPAGQGDFYSYQIRKYWVVRDVLEDGLVVAETRTGKLNYLPITDPNLRRAGFFEELLRGDRFPHFA